MPVKAIPEGYHSVTPYLIVKDPAAALDFYQKAFGAIELYRMAGADGKIIHAEFQIGDSRLMIGAENPTMGVQSPLSLTGTAVSMCLYVEDVDATYTHALAVGGKEIRGLADQFYGDRSGTFSDPFGHLWTVSTHKEDVSPEEMTKRMQELASKQTQSAA